MAKALAKKLGGVALANKNCKNLFSTSPDLTNTCKFVIITIRKIHRTVSGLNEATPTVILKPSAGKLLLVRRS